VYAANTHEFKDATAQLVRHLRSPTNTDDERLIAIDGAFCCATRL
jgi:hypothetical protein